MTKLSDLDRFAIAALQGIDTWSPEDKPLFNHEGLTARATWAYEQAQAMLDARAKHLNAQTTLTSTDPRSKYRPFKQLEIGRRYIDRDNRIWMCERVTTSKTYPFLCVCQEKQQTHSFTREGAILHSNTAHAYDLIQEIIS